MERILGVLGHSEGSVRPEILIAYGAIAILVSVFVNWVLTLLLFMIKPFTCAAIMMAFIRPDLAQNLFQETYLKFVLDKSKILMYAFSDFIIQLAQQIHAKIN